MIDVIVFLVVIALGFGVINSFSKELGVDDKKNLKNLWFYHLSFGVIYWLYIAYGPGGDSIGYYRASKELNIGEALALFGQYGPGTYGMYLLNVFPAKIIGFFGMTMLYTLIGYMGIVFFYLVFIKHIHYNSTIGKFKLFPLVFFLPNLHFWSAGLGKDTLLFFCIGLFIYSMQQPSKNVIKIVLALILSYIVRPHITIFLIASFGLGYVLDGNLKTYQKILIGGVFLIAFVSLFDNIMAFLKIEDLNTETIDQFAENRVSGLSRDHTGSGVDISSYPFPLKVFTFLYRPLFFDINGVLAIVASFENLLLLVLSWRFIRLNPIKIFNAANYMFKSMFIFLIIGSVTFSIILGNLGIMLRQKNMFIPALLFICLWSFSYNAEKK
ncbi:hypothetical protein Aeqsu_2913 [Aequorivita sublithincola DSM 14238]|uniref:Uncharacterized protein n=1 Tax=Aequorivita sublithincola (strain DSM 14238 / LMG 21431 / ACAM 643 / 9-3) TaxID=746697 RepID=I3YZD6_AEQSU|nr:hypothetical protein [Aequorivita sublithincola]AFL82354.1 hypothetical protein Aeqsu_2913 [Aequorivita sublithincola DSM 14238]